MNKVIGFLVAFASLPLAAQWFDHKDPRIPRTKDGRPDLSAPAPRLNGKPDLTGLWQAERTPESEYVSVLGEDLVKLEIDLVLVNKYAFNIFWGLKPEEEPMRPAAVEIRKRRMEEPPTVCLPGSAPGAMLLLPFKIIQTPHELVVLFEDGIPRQIYTDGRKLIGNPDPSWTGYSIARWEGDTLVVETNGFNDRLGLDFLGHPLSEEMRMTERYRRRDFGHMDLEVSLNDPKYYTRPFGFKIQLNLIPDSDVLPYVCNENERDREHIK